MTDTQTKTPEQIAEDIANSKIEAMKHTLIEGLGGGQSSRYGEAGPGSWDNLHNSIKDDAVQTAVAEAEKKITEKFEQREQAEKQRKEKTLEQQKADADREYSQVLTEWKEAVQDNLLPAIDPAIEQKIAAGTTYDKLTPEERLDPGLVAYNESLALHAQLKREGKSSSFYRTIGQFYGKQPAGASAPVFGASVSSQQPNQDYTYDEIHAATKKHSKFAN